MRCPNCHDTHVRNALPNDWTCANCGYEWTLDDDRDAYDVLDRLDDLNCRYEMLVGR